MYFKGACNEKKEFNYLKITVKNYVHTIKKQYIRKKHITRITIKCVSWQYTIANVLVLSDIYIQKQEHKGKKTLYFL